MTTGQRMKARRKQIGLSAERVAEILGVSPATIYRYENGDIEKVPGERLRPIADALNTTPAYLMGWSDDPLTNAEGKRIRIRSTPDQELSTEELELIHKFRRLDARGRSAVMNVLNYEYTSLAGDEGNPLPKQA